MVSGNQYNGFPSIRSWSGITDPPTLTVHILLKQAGDFDNRSLFLLLTLRIFRFRIAVLPGAVVPDA